MKSELQSLKLVSVLILVSTASWLDFIAVLSLFASDDTGGPMSVAMVSIALLAPPALLANRYRLVISKWDIKSSLFVGLVARSFLTLGVAVLSESVFAVLILLTIRSAFNGLFLPQISALSSRIDESRKQRHSAYISLSNNSAKLIAPALGGVLAVAYGNETVILLASGLLLIGAIASMLLSWDYAKPNYHEPKILNSLSRDFKLEITHASFYYFLVFSSSNLLPYIFHDIGLGTFLFSIAISCSAIGNIIAGLIGIRKLKIHRLSFLSFALAVCALFCLIYILIVIDMKHLIPATFIFTGVFSALVQLNITRNTISLKENEAVMYSSLFQTGQNSAMLFGPMFGAFIVSYVSSEMLFLTTSLIGIAYFTAMKLFGGGRELVY